MKSWVNDYKGKLSTADEAVRLVQSGQTVYTSGNAATPTELLKALAHRKDELSNVRLAHALLMGNDLGQSLASFRN